jgi:predicted PurR-regulated permease PerM
MGLRPSARGEKSLVISQTARRAAIATLVVGGIVVLALALWELKLLVSLLFLAFIIAAAMRPGIDALHRRRIPRAVGVGIHYLVLAGLVALFLWAVVPRALSQVQAAAGNLPKTSSELHNAARGSTGLKHDVLVNLERRLKNLPSATDLVRPGLAVTVKAFEGLVAVFFVLASAAYWIFERDRAVDLVCSLLPRPKRKTVRDTWTLIDLKLGAYVRGQGILVILVGTLLSLAFLLIGEPYWILVGSFAGLVEIVPVIGPLAAGALAVGVGLTDSVRTAVVAGVAVLVVRLMEDYVIMPRVLGEAVGLSPLLVLFSVTAVGLLFGGFAVILAIPIVAVLTTLIDVIVRDRDPAEEDVPTVLFPAKEAET